MCGLSIAVQRRGDVAATATVESIGDVEFEHHCLIVRLNGGLNNVHCTLASSRNAHSQLNGRE